MEQLNGVIHGRTIYLDSDPGFAQGQAIKLSISSESAKSGNWGDGIRKAAGSLADMPELDAAMDRIYEDRKLESKRRFLDGES